MMLFAASAASRLSFWADSKHAGRAANMSFTGSDQPMMPVEHGNTYGYRVRHNQGKYTNKPYKMGRGTKRYKYQLRKLSK